MIRTRDSGHRPCEERFSGPEGIMLAVYLVVGQEKNEMVDSSTPRIHTGWVLLRIEIQPGPEE